jgi:large subunit ribosomal protein L4
MKLEVLNKDGQSTGRTVELPENVFGIEPNAHAVYLAVKQYNAAQRQGTHKAKEKNEIAKSTKKIKRQKGTGTARAGSAKSPVFRGGGRVFGPKPRNYSFKLNKKVKELARFSALSDKASNGMIKVVEDFQIEKPSTKSYINVLNSLNVQGKSIYILPQYNSNVYLSGRNVPGAAVVFAGDLNTYEILNADVLLLSEKAVNHFNQETV